MTIATSIPTSPASAPQKAQPDFAAIKTKQQATWASGNFAVIGTTLQIVGETLAEAVDVCAGERVLDIAAGNGNATLAAARRFAEVTSTDYVPALLDQGAARAKAEGLAVVFQTADAEALPFADASFDVALSTFGAMFTPQHAHTAGEMLRVVRAGGRIGLANWTPEGFIGQLFKVIGASRSRTSLNCSARKRPRSAASAASSTSATAPLRTGSRSSVPITGRRTRHSPRWTPQVRRRWRPTSPRFWIG